MMYTALDVEELVYHPCIAPPLVPCPWKLEPANEAAAAALRVFEPQIFTEEAASCHTCAQDSGRVHWPLIRRTQARAWIRYWGMFRGMDSRADIIMFIGASPLQCCVM